MNTAIIHVTGYKRAKTLRTNPYFLTTDDRQKYGNLNVEKTSELMGIIFISSFHPIHK
jgi:hypothetical protein